MDSDADRLALIKGLGGQLVRHDAGEFWAVFDREYVLILDGVESRSTALSAARTSDIDALPKDTLLTIDGEDWQIKRHEPDGTGMSVVMLKL